MFVMKSATRLRVARPTDHLADVVRFYRDGVGLKEIGSFQDHEGFDGVMLGVPGASYHLEFTRQHGHTVGRASTEENILVLYLPSRQEWQAAIDRMVGAGYTPVAAYNPTGIVQGARSNIRKVIVSLANSYSCGNRRLE